MGPPTALTAAAAVVDRMTAEAPSHTCTHPQAVPAGCWCCQAGLYVTQAYIRPRTWHSSSSGSRRQPWKMRVLPTMLIMAATTMSASRDTSRCMLRTCQHQQQQRQHMLMAQWRQQQEVAMHTHRHLLGCCSPQAEHLTANAHIMQPSQQEQTHTATTSLVSATQHNRQNQHTCSSAMPHPMRVTPSTREGLAKSTFTIARGGSTCLRMLLKRRLCETDCLKLLLSGRVKGPLPLLLLLLWLRGRTAVQRRTRGRPACVAALS